MHIKVVSYTLLYKPDFIWKNVSVYEMIYETTLAYMKKINVYQLTWLYIKNIWKNLSVYESAHDKIRVYDLAWLYMKRPEWNNRLASKLIIISKKSETIEVKKKLLNFFKWINEQKSNGTAW